MIRLIIEVLPANDHVHADCPIRKYYRTCDIEHEALEQLLRGNPKAFLSATLVGAEIVSPKAEGEE